MLVPTGSSLRNIGRCRVVYSALYFGLPGRGQGQASTTAHSSDAERDTTLYGRPSATTAPRNHEASRSASV